MATIRLDFCDFYPGYPKTDNFFFNLLRSRFDVQITDQPDFLIYSNPETHLHRVHNCVRIYFGVESFLPDWTECDYALTCHYLEDPRHFRLPSYVLCGDAGLLRKGQDDFDAIFSRKSKFCSFVVSNAGKRKTQKRVDFFHRLSKYKRVDSGGRHLNNIGGPIRTVPGAKTEFLRDYKFNIAFENASIPGYTTEKIVDAMQARCLPIYWGNPLIAKEFNSESFINYFDFGSEEDVIERIIELDKNDALYMEHLRKPYFHADQPNEAFDQERLLAFFGKIFEAKITPVSAARPKLHLGRWIGVKKNRRHYAP